MQVGFCYFLSLPNPLLLTMIMVVTVVAARIMPPDCGCDISVAVFGYIVCVCTYDVVSTV